MADENPNDLQALHHLAELSGIQLSYTDGLGHTREAKTEPLIHVLRLLGHEITDLSQAPAALKAATLSSWYFHVEPSTVVWRGETGTLAIRCPAGAYAAISCSLQIEDGELIEWQTELSQLQAHAGHEIDGHHYVERLLPLPLLPVGYHKLHLKHASFEADVFLISAPRRAFEFEGDSEWGVFAPLYSLHSDRSWGAGDLSDLRTLADWTHDQGGSFVATLPLLAMFLGEQSYSASPYSPVSRLFWNEFYIDAARAAEGCPPALDFLHQDSTLQAIRQARSADTVQYRDIFKLKRQLLEKLATCRQSDVPEPDNLRTQYARFRAVHERQQRPWQQWPEALRAGTITPDDYDAEVYAFYLMAQQVIDEQMEDLKHDLAVRSQKLYLDLPIGGHSDGFDAWRYAGLFADGVSCGAPPDRLFTLGQDWGLPPQIPSRMRASGYEYLRQMLTHHLSLADVLRFDHVIGLRRLYWIPNGSPATEGIFVTYPQDELFAILAIESNRHRSVIVGENLGTVPPEVNEAMMRHGVYETYVLQYELPGAAQRALRTAPRGALASLNTHDMPPFASYWSGDDIDLRTRLGISNETLAEQERQERATERETLQRVLLEEGLLTEGSGDVAKLFEASVRLLARSAAQYIVINLEDLWLETETQNVPGTAEGNWQRPLRRALSDLPQQTPLSNRQTDD